MESTANIPTGPCGPQSSPQPESHPAPQAAPVRMRRVGTLTMGCVMILAGVVICISLFGGEPSLELLFRLSPLILVALGVEVLLASRQKNQRLKYDFVSIFLSFVLVGATLCFAAVPLVWNYIGPTRAQAENNLEQQIYNRIYQQVGADTVQGMQVYVSLNALEVKNADLTLEDLSKGGSAHISIQLQPEYADPAKLAAAFGLSSLDKDAFAVIWTTTAWTIPANQALNVHPELSYALVDTPKGVLLLAEALVEKATTRYGFTADQVKVLATTAGAKLEHLKFKHPLAHVDAGYDRESPVYLADYVSAEDGTGIVHSAPAYGVDDFNSCVANGLKFDDILNPVQGHGVYEAELPLFGGQHIWKAAPVVLETLREHGRVLASSEITHSYPHCWRHKKPVIFRAAAQWFVRMDEGQGVFTTNKADKTLRQLALDAIDQTSFYPENGRARLRDMIANRPDWCISRQRNWGVPLPFFLHKITGELHPQTLAFIDRAADLVQQGGVEAWSKLDPAEWLGTEAADYSKSTDILDVWFDSGSTFFHVLNPEQGSHPTAGHAHGPEADLYLEGHDQHRGWFHSSLLVACAIYGRAPYKGLLTHGFTVDSQGRKMSKSLGNGVDPQETSKKLGAEIIRLWVASSDYSGDIAGDDKILARVVDGYRRIRNTLRFLLANTVDFDPKADTVAASDLLEIDRHALARAAELQADILAHYERYEFHPVVGKLQVYCSEDLGAFYLDVLKDRLYTTGAKSLARRSAQTALWQITQAMLRWMAPFLSFTAEEAWQVLGLGETIFTETYSDFAGAEQQTELLAKWARIREIRELVNKEIEAVRTTGQVGASLQAEIELTAPSEDHALLASLGDDLKFVLIVSKVTLREGDAIAVKVTPSEAAKCERCWHYRDDVGSDPRYVGVCGRCALNLGGAGETRTVA